VECSAVAFFLVSATAGQAESTLPPGFRSYPSHYYVIHTDLPESQVQEAVWRLTRMFEAYRARTQAFTGKITTLFPFYLFGKAEDYYAAGGLPGSGGVYTGQALLAIAEKQCSAAPWSTLQHEGFHQFLDKAVGGDVPVWVNEGLAVYFEEAIFTGDGMVSGIVPQRRLERLRTLMRDDRVRPLAEMMLLERNVWNHALSADNYLQAWSMAHFLAHADDGKYRPAFDRFLHDMSLKGWTWEHAWTTHFGPDVAAFEAAWRKYWLAMADDPSRDLYDQAVVASLTSFLARADSQGQRFDNAEMFLLAARAGKLKSHVDDWLPPSRLEYALDRVERTGAWTLIAQGRQPPRLECRTPAGVTWVGSFTVTAGRASQVEVTRVGA